MNPYLTAGLSGFAAAALFEAALIPGIVIGGAALLAPKYLPELRRRLQPAFDAIVRARIEPPAHLPERQDVEPTDPVPAELAVKQALFKTITFRVIGTSLDFTTNYVVVADIATAADLSAFGFVVGPFVYFGHERVWDYFSAPGVRTLDAQPPTDRELVIGPRQRLGGVSET